MRKLIVLAVVAGLIGAGGFTRDARAGATIDLLFVGINGSAIAATNTVTASVGDDLRMALRLTGDQQWWVAVFSLNYDLDSDNELDVISAFQWTGVFVNKQGDKSDPVAGLNPTTSTFVGSFQATSSDLSPPITGLPTGVAYQIGTVVWDVQAGVNNDGADILSGLFDTVVDGFSDTGFNFITSGVFLFRSATVNAVPEPGTASLIGLGLVGLVLAGRRYRR